MNYESRKKASGFMLIELLVVIAIIAILAASAAPIGSAFLARNHFRNKTNEVVSSLRSAKLNAISGKENSKWGAYIGSSQITVFKGNTFATRDTAFDELFEIPASVTITQEEVVFDRLTGEPDSIASIIITSVSGDTNTISVNEVGVVNIN